MQCNQPGTYPCRTPTPHQPHPPLPPRNRPHMQPSRAPLTYVLRWYCKFAHLHARAAGVPALFCPAGWLPARWVLQGCVPALMCRVRGGRDWERAGGAGRVTWVWGFQLRLCESRLGSWIGDGLLLCVRGYVCMCVCDTARATGSVQKVLCSSSLTP